MSWTAKTWQPKVPRDEPLIIAGAFYAFMGLLFLGSWYTDYLTGGTRRLPVFILAAAALVAPALLTWRQARRAGRRRALWAILVLGGTALALWLPVQYLLMSESLPPYTQVVLPEVLSQAQAATFVTLVPLAMGALPFVLYGFALGQTRPMPGVPPRIAVVAIWAGGTLLLTGTLFVAMLKPASPPLVSVPAPNTITLRVERPPTMETEATYATWNKLLWRFRDALPPGASDVSVNQEELTVSLPRFAEPGTTLSFLIATGVIEIVDTGESRPTPDTEVSTTYSPLDDTSDRHETLISPQDLLFHEHWSGMAIADVRVETETGQRDEARLILPLTVESVRQIEDRLSTDRPSNLSLVMDNVVLAPLTSPDVIAGTGLAINGLDPPLARMVAAILRYDTLPLTPAVEAAQGAQFGG